MKAFLLFMLCLFMPIASWAELASGKWGTNLGDGKVTIADITTPIDVIVNQ